MALHLERDGQAVQPVEGREFAVLPVGRRTGLPVHTSAVFELPADSKLYHTEPTRDVQQRMQARWNTALYTNIVDAYVAVLVWASTSHCAANPLLREPTLGLFLPDPIHSRRKKRIGCISLAIQRGPQGIALKSRCVCINFCRLLALQATGRRSASPQCRAGLTRRGVRGVTGAWTLEMRPGDAPPNTSFKYDF